MAVAEVVSTVDSLSPSMPDSPPISSSGDPRLVTAAGPALPGPPQIPVWGRPENATAPDQYDRGSFRA